MMILYWTCLAAGGLLLAVSLLGSEAGGDLDADLDLDLDMDLDADLELDTGFDPDLDADAASPGDGDGGWSDAARFLSFRDVVFFSAFFGLTGVLLRLTGTGEPLVALIAGTMGVGAAAVTRRAMRWLKSTESGQGRSEREIEGRRARVLVPLDRTHRGKIALDTGERTVHLLACVAEESSAEGFEPGDEVTIVHYRDGTARVIEPGGF